MISASLSPIFERFKRSNLQLITIAVATLLLAGCAGSYFSEDGTNEIDSAFANEVPDEAAKANYDLAIGYTRQGRLAEAQEKLIKAISFDNKYYEAYNALGVIYEELQSYTKATKAYSLAAADPDYHLAQLNYARLLCAYPDIEPNSTSKAISLYEKVASRTGPVTANTALVGAGVCQAKNNNLRAAEQTIGKVLASNPNLPIAVIEMADLQFRLGRRAQGEQLLRRYISVQGPDARAVQIAGQNGVRI